MLSLISASSQALTMTPVVRVPISSARAHPLMGLFDGLAAAFENDDSLGEAGPAGLKTKVSYQEVTWKGPVPEGPAAMMGLEKQFVKTTQAIPGQSIKDLAEEAGVPVKYSCNKVREKE